MSFTITNLSDSKPFARKILVYGSSNAGKTFFSGSAVSVQEMKEVLVVNLDAGSKTLDGMDISATDARKLSELEEVIWAFKQRSPEVARFKCLIIDGVSEVAKRELSEITELESKTDKGKARSRDKDQAELKDYGLRNSRLLRILRMARDLPDITVVCTAWAKKLFPKIPGTDQDNKAAKPIAITPDFSDSIVPVIIGMMDDCWFLRNDDENERRVLYTSDYEGIAAKTRGDRFARSLGIEKDGKFLPVVINPTFTTIVDAYRKAMNTKKEK